MTNEEKRLLEIDLCPRLPYGVKALFKDATTKVAMVARISNDKISRITDSGYGYFDSTYEKVTPIYRPMSDITKEITHKGETFVPAERMAVKFEMNVVELNIIIQNLENGKLIKNIIRAVIAEWLEEHHFNVNDLPAHLWVDVNTLEIDCYA